MQKTMASLNVNCCLVKKKVSLLIWLHLRNKKNPLNFNYIDKNWEHSWSYLNTLTQVTSLLQHTNVKVIKTAMCTVGTLLQWTQTPNSKQTLQGKKTGLGIRTFRKLSKEKQKPKNLSAARILNIYPSKICTEMLKWSFILHVITEFRKTKKNNTLNL